MLARIKINLFLVKGAPELNVFIATWLPDLIQCFQNVIPVYEWALWREDKCNILRVHYADDDTHFPLNQLNHIDGLMQKRCNSSALVMELHLFYMMSSISGGRLNKKDGLTRYGDSHVKDKTS